MDQIGMDEEGNSINAGKYAHPFSSVRRFQLMVGFELCTGTQIWDVSFIGFVDYYKEES